MKTQKIQLVLFVLYFFIASKFFPLFQLALFVPLMCLFTDSTKTMQTVGTAFLLGFTIDLISFSYPMGFYTIGYVLLSFLLYKVKGSIALFKPLPQLLFFYLSIVSMMALLMVLSLLFGKPLMYTPFYCLLDLFVLPFYETCIAGNVFLFLPFLIKKKFFIEIILEKMKKKKHG